MKKLAILFLVLSGTDCFAQEGAARIFAESLLGLYTNPRESQADTVYIYSRYTHVTWQIVDQPADPSKSDTVIFHSCSQPSKDLSTGKALNQEVYYVIWKDRSLWNTFWVKRFDSSHGYDKTSIGLARLTPQKQLEPYTFPESSRQYCQGSFAFSGLEIKTRAGSTTYSMADSERAQKGGSNLGQLLQNIELALFDKEHE